MAFEESLMMLTSLQILNEEHIHQSRNSLSRLSICTNSVHGDEHDGAEADGEVSDDGKKKKTKSDSDSELYEIPLTPSRRRKKPQVSVTFSGEVEEDGDDGSKCNLRRQRRVIKEKKKKKRIVNNGDGNGTVLTARAKGGEKSLKMGLEEVKACRDLGFELDVPGRISVSNGGGGSSSGSNSPIATWRISSPGDDPKEVKARLKVWAQAVALASASSQAF